MQLPHPDTKAIVIMSKDYTVLGFISKISGKSVPALIHEAVGLLLKEYHGKTTVGTVKKAESQT